MRQAINKGDDASHCLIPLQVGNIESLYVMGRHFKLQNLLNNAYEVLFLALPTALQQVFRIGHRHLDQSELFAPEGSVDHNLVPCQITEPFCNGKKIFNRLRNENPFGDKGLATIVLL